jgi:hypothetical protein
LTNTRRRYPYQRSLTCLRSKPAITPILRSRCTAHARPSVISVAIVALLKELEATFDPPCLAIARTAWSQLNLVSGPSKNVIDLIQAVENVVQAVRVRIERPKYTRNFLDKAARFASFKLYSGLVINPLPELNPSEIHARLCEESAAQGDGCRTGDSDSGRWLA